MENTKRGICKPRILGILILHEQNFLMQFSLLESKYNNKLNEKTKILLKDFQNMDFFFQAHLGYCV